MIRLHIAYFLDYGQSFGGAANTLLQQALLMKKAGLKVTIIISDYLSKNLEIGYLNVCENNNIKWMQLTYPICSHTEDIDIVSIIDNFDIVKAKIAELKPDVLHSVQINPIAELVSRELKIPHVMNIYPLIPDFFSIKYTDVFPKYHICDSFYYAKKWKSYLNTESVCIRTVARTIKKKRRNSITRKEYINYMCVGSIYERKNQFEVIRAFHKALKLGIKGKLFIYGYCEGIYAKKCEKYIFEYKLNDYIVLRGFCTNMEEEYQKNDVLICGSTMESYPNVISEALANGLVIISTPVAGVPEVIKDRYNGFLCKGFTHEDILEKIIEFNNERYSNFIKEIVDNAYNTFEKYHSPKTITRQLLEYYSFLVEKYSQNKNLLIYDIKKKFHEILLLYEKNASKFSDCTAVKQKLWYIYHIKAIVSKKIFEEKRKIYIWGTGKYGRIAKELLDIFWDGATLYAYIDTYKKEFYEGYEIFSPTDILRKEKIVIIVAAVNGQEDMIKQLRNNNKIYNSDYFIFSPRVW